MAAFAGIILGIFLGVLLAIVVAIVWLLRQGGLLP
jgi:hypothetical protein